MASPVPVLIIIGIYAVFFAVITATAEPSEDDASAAINDDCGLVCGLGDVLRIVFDFVGFLFDALTFNVDGAPFYVRFPIAVAINASLLWAIVSLIRGSDG